MKLHEIKGRVHTLRNPNIKPRGAPENPARAFDQGKVNRSVLKKTTEFYTIQGETNFIDWSDPESDELMHFDNNVMVHVMGGFDGELPEGYYGINVVFTLLDNKFELDHEQEPYCVGGDPVAKRQIEKHEKRIIQAAIDGLKKGDIPGIYDGLGGVKHTLGKVPGADKLVNPIRK